MTACCNTTQLPWFKRKLVILGLSGLLSIFVCKFFTKTINVYHYFIEMTQLMWWAILLGIIIGGCIDYLIPRSYIEKIFARRKKRTILYSVIIGTVLSTCSHGILAISMQLYKKGASIPAIVALLTASPWANFPITILLLRFFGLKGLAIIGCSIIIALILGWVFQLLEYKNLLDSNRSSFDPSLSEFSIKKDIKKRISAYSFSKKQSISDLKNIVHSSLHLSDMVLWWFVIALTMATYIQFLVPAHFFHTYLGNNNLGLITTLGVTSLIEVCSEGSSVLAFELYNQTQAFGNVLVFLFAGVVTDYTEIGLIWSNIGRKTAILLPIMSIPIILLMGYILNIYL